MHIPTSTYRIQLHQGFSLQELSRIIDYLHELGVSTVYAAPLARATPGSMHGYDVTDPHNINPEVGTRHDLAEIAEELKRRDMRWLQDIVPNHMAFSFYNIRLMDALERGKSSPFYRYFDIDWEHPDDLLKGKLMTPILGKDLNDCLRENEIKLAFSEYGFTIDYFDNRVPVSVESIHLINTISNQSLAERLLRYKEAAISMSGLETWLPFKKKWIAEIRNDSKLALLVNEVVTSINDDPAMISKIVGDQNYLLTYWKETQNRINYRRFFTVNSLICLNTQDEKVFDDYHRFFHDLYKKDVIHGLRIDHIDGLYDPTGYIERLRKVFGSECFIIAEKILETNEELPEHWQLQGTSGYEFLSHVNKLLTDRKGARKLFDFYKQLVPDVPDYHELVQKNKNLILHEHMAGELANLVHLFFQLGLGDGFAIEKIKDALAALMLAMPVYRIYPDKIPLQPVEEELLKEAFAKARDAQSDIESELAHLQYLFIEGNGNENALNFLKRLMQFTGPLTAKGVEDTTFYIYNPLISHDEVGDSPSKFGIPVAEFHRRMINRSKKNNFSLNATATHDTKRGEDARIRLNVLSGIPDQWIEGVKIWMAMNKRHKTSIDGMLAPSINDEYFIYQSIVGGFPEDIEVNPDWISRLKEYIIKVVREAKVHSGWELPNEEYENGCTRFIEQILSPSSEFVESLMPILSKIVDVANDYSIAQAVLKITCPGIPDIYQGCELWDLSYVDPDNRRPVDFEKRINFLEDLKNAELKGWEPVNNLLQQRSSLGMNKIFAIWKLMNFRRDNPDIFNNGEYTPILCDGPAMGYVRTSGKITCLVVVPLGLSRKFETDEAELARNFISLPANSPRRWRNIFSNNTITSKDERLPFEELFKDFKVAVFKND